MRQLHPTSELRDACLDGPAVARQGKRIATPEWLAPAMDRGRTFISDDVVSVIARIAAETVEGVHQLGSSTLRAMFDGSLRHQGVGAEVGMKEAAVDVEIVAEFGYPIRAVTQTLRERIVEAVERSAGRRVVEVNIYVIDVHVGKSERHRTRELE